MSSTMSFEEAVAKATRDDLVRAMEWSLSEDLFIDSAGVIYDDCSCGDYWPEFSDRVRRMLIEEVSDRLACPEQCPSSANELVSTVVAEVTGKVYETALESAYEYGHELLASAPAGFADSLSRSLGSEVEEPTWPELLSALVDEGLWRFELEAVSQLCLDAELRAEVLLGPDGVYSGDPLSTEDALAVVSGTNKDPDPAQLSQTPALALAEAAGVSLEQLRSAMRAHWRGEAAPSSGADRLAATLAEELDEYTSYGCSQVAVLCTATLPELAGLVAGEGGRALAVGPEPPLCGLYDRFVGCGGVFAIELPEGFSLEPRGSASPLAVDRVMLPEASHLPWWSVEDTYGLLPSAYDARLGVAVKQPRDSENPPLEESRDMTGREGGLDAARDVERVPEL